MVVQHWFCFHCTLISTHTHTQKEAIPPPLNQARQLGPIGHTTFNWGGCCRYTFGFRGHFPIIDGGNVTHSLSDFHYSLTNQVVYCSRYGKLLCDAGHELKAALMHVCCSRLVQINRVYWPTSNQHLVHTVSHCQVCVIAH